jgi:protein-S-isoprenylcysteine O-methyltransferase Ste14
MEYIVLGIGGFLVAYLFDLVSLRKIPYGKQAIELMAICLALYAHIMVCIRGERLSLALGLSYLGWPLFGLACLAMIYSLFLEIPFKRTYVAEGTGNKLVTTGTYALARHPGVLWYALLLISLILISQRQLILLAAPIWLLMDVLYVWLQDRSFFPRMFPDYPRYQRETPMLIPNRTSIVRCLRTFTDGWKRANQLQTGEKPGHDRRVAQARTEVGYSNVDSLT